MASNPVAMPGSYLNRQHVELFLLALVLIHMEYACAGSPYADFNMGLRHLESGQIDQAEQVFQLVIERGQGTELEAIPA